MLLASSRHVAGLPLCARKSFSALETLCAAAMASDTDALQSSHYSSLVWIVIRSVELGCCDEITKSRFGIGRAH